MKPYLSLFILFMGYHSHAQALKVEKNVDFKTACHTRVRDLKTNAVLLDRSAGSIILRAKDYGGGFEMSVPEEFIFVGKDYQIYEDSSVRTNGRAKGSRKNDEVQFYFSKLFKIKGTKPTNIDPKTGKPADQPYYDLLGWKNPGKFESVREIDLEVSQNKPIAYEDIHLLNVRLELECIRR